MRYSAPNQIAAATFARLKTDPAGAALRALLGAGAASVITADALKVGAELLPARPLVALRVGPVPTLGHVDGHAYSLWIYDDPDQGTARIDQIAAAVPLAFDTDRGAPPLAGGVRLGALAEPRHDPALGLEARRYDLTVYA